MKINAKELKLGDSFILKFFKKTMPLTIEFAGMQAKFKMMPTSGGIELYYCGFGHVRPVPVGAEYLCLECARQDYTCDSSQDSWASNRRVKCRIHHVMMHPYNEVMDQIEVDEQRRRQMRALLSEDCQQEAKKVQRITLDL